MWDPSKNPNTGFAIIGVATVMLSHHPEGRYSREANYLEWARGPRRSTDCPMLAPVDRYPWAVAEASCDDRGSSMVEYLFVLGEVPRKHVWWIM